MNWYFTYESWNTLGSFSLFITVKALANWIWDTSINLKQNFKKLAVILHVLQTTQNWSFHVVVLPRTAKKCTKIYNVHAQPLFCSLNVLFSDVAVAVEVVVILNSLIPLIDRTLVGCVSHCHHVVSWDWNNSFVLSPSFTHGIFINPNQQYVTFIKY